MSLKRSAHPPVPPAPPGLGDRIREAERARRLGLEPASGERAQRVLRPSLDAISPERERQARTVGLIEPGYRRGVDGRAAIASGASSRDDLDACWDELSETEKARAGGTERFRLELETELAGAGLSTAPVRELGGRLDARALRRSAGRLEGELRAVAGLLAPDAAALVQRFVAETHGVVRLALEHRGVRGVDAAGMHGILRDLAHKLLWQELASRGRSMGDRGVRHVMGAVDLAERACRELSRSSRLGPRARLLVRVVQVHQDLGLAMRAARTSWRAGRMHAVWSARIFDDEQERYAGLFGRRDLELAREAVATHDAPELPFAEAPVLAVVRAASHLAPFAPHRIVGRLAGQEGVREALETSLAGATAGDVGRWDAGRAALDRALAAAGVGDPFRADVLAGLLPLDRGAEPVPLGTLAGEIALAAGPSGGPRLVARLAPDALVERYQLLFDVGQEQLVRLARESGVSREQLSRGPPVRLGAPGGGLLAITW